MKNSLGQKLLFCLICLGISGLISQRAQAAQDNLLDREFNPGASAMHQARSKICQQQQDFHSNAISKLDSTNWPTLEQLNDSESRKQELAKLTINIPEPLSQEFSQLVKLTLGSWNSTIVNSLAGAPGAADDLTRLFNEELAKIAQNFECEGYSADFIAPRIPGVCTQSSVTKLLEGEASGGLDFHEGAYWAAVVGGALFTHENGNTPFFDSKNRDPEATGGVVFSSSGKLFANINGKIMTRTSKSSPIEVYHDPQEGPISGDILFDADGALIYVINGKMFKSKEYLFDLDTTDVGQMAFAGLRLMINMGGRIVRLQNNPFLELYNSNGLQSGGIFVDGTDWWATIGNRLVKNEEEIGSFEFGLAEGGPGGIGVDRDGHYYVNVGGDVYIDGTTMASKVINTDEDTSGGLKVLHPGVWAAVVGGNLHICRDLNPKD